MIVLYSAVLPNGTSSGRWDGQTAKGQRISESYESAPANSQNCLFVQPSQVVLEHSTLFAAEDGDHQRKTAMVTLRFLSGDLGYVLSFLQLKIHHQLKISSKVPSGTFWPFAIAKGARPCPVARGPQGHRHKPRAPGQQPHSRVHLPFATCHFPLSLLSSPSLTH